MIGQNTIRRNFSIVTAFNEKINFTSSDTDYTIILEVNKPLTHIDVKFTSLIDKGDMVIEILDPNGKREGGFELEAKDANDPKGKSTSVNGIMGKRINNPLKGEWTIKIELAKAEGVVDVYADIIF